MLDVQRLPRRSFWRRRVRRSFFVSGRVAESGLRHSTRNRAWGNPPWVRIPPLPLALSKRASGQGSALFRQDWHLATSSRYDHLDVAPWDEITVASRLLIGSFLASS